MRDIDGEWKIYYQKRGHYGTEEAFVVNTKSGGKVICRAEKKSIARRIVRDHNCHDDLVEMLRQYRAFYYMQKGKYSVLIDKFIAVVEEKG